MAREASEAFTAWHESSGVASELGDVVILACSLTQTLGVDMVATVTVKLGADQARTPRRIDLMRAVGSYCPRN